MENEFKRVVERIFNNWSALKLTVEHNVGASEGTKAALEFMNYMVNYCLYESTVSVESIQEALDDIMDEEFETICEDGSTKEIAIILYKFLHLLKQNNFPEFENEFNKLPTSSEWLISTPSTDEIKKENIKDNQEQKENAASSCNEIPMEQDSDWIEVKSRRK